MISSSHQKFSLDNKNNSQLNSNLLKNNQIECKQKSSEIDDFCTDDTDDSKLETLIDRFAEELSITKEKPTAIKSANDALNKSNLLNFDYIVTNNKYNKKSFVKNFIQTESINNPFDDNELGIKTINI